jgi:hypothetical protein
MMAMQSASPGIVSRDPRGGAEMNEDGVVAAEHANVRRL